MKDFTESHLAKIRALHNKLDTHPPTDVLVRILVEMVTDGIAVFDDKGTILSANHALEHAFGYDNGELVGKNVNELIPADLRDKHDVLMEDWFNAPRVIGIPHRKPVRGMKKDGTEFWFKGGLCPVGDGSGTVVFSMKIVNQESPEHATL